MRLTHLPNFRAESLVDRAGKATYPSITHFLEGLWRRGQWQPVVYSAADFSGTGAMTWTVEEADMVTFAYMLNGRTATVSFILENTSIGGVPDVRLQILLPGGLIPSRSMHSGGGFCYDAGWVPAVVEAPDGVPALYVRRTDAAVWTASVNNTHVYGQIAFEVQG